MTEVRPSGIARGHPGLEIKTIALSIERGALRGISYIYGTRLRHVSLSVSKLVCVRGTIKVKTLLDMFINNLGF